jgi:hypothetical protein
MASKVKPFAAYGLAGLFLLLLTLTYGSSSQGRITNRHTLNSQHDKRAEPDLCMLILSQSLALDVY